MPRENTRAVWYESRYLFLILSTLLLCILDSFFSINIIQLGGREANPLMAALLQKNVALSLVLKYVITAAGLVLLLIYKNFRFFGKFRVSKFFYVVFGIYLMLVLTEMFTYSTLMGQELGILY
jgi:hypothetical protein